MSEYIPNSKLLVILNLINTYTSSDIEIDEIILDNNSYKRILDECNKNYIPNISFKNNNKSFLYMGIKISCSIEYDDYLSDNISRIEIITKRKNTLENLIKKMNGE